jgi:N,N'-diacetyllegionaminate synthase
MDHVIVVAECASAHDGELATAKRQIEAAIDAGADVAKFQYWSDGDALADSRPVPVYYRAIYRRYRMPPDWVPHLAGFCDGAGIGFACSVFLPQDVPTVAPFVRFLKISGFESQAAALWEAVNVTGRPMVASLGMADDLETRRAVAWRNMRRQDAPTDLLHGVNHYDGPIPSDQWNLGAIHRYDLDGFSDHTRDIRAGYEAVLAGARIVEVHCRANSTSPDNPDYGCAWDPRQLIEYVALVREAEAKRGDGVKRAMPCEAEMQRYRVKA